MAQVRPEAHQGLSLPKVSSQLERSPCLPVSFLPARRRRRSPISPAARLLCFLNEQGILPVQQLQGVRGAEAGGAKPRGPQHLHPHLHRRAQPRGADPPELARRHHPPQVPRLGDASAAAAVRRGGRRRRRSRSRPRRRAAPAPAAEPEPDVDVDRGALAHDAAAHAVHGGGRRGGGGRAAGGGHGDGRRGRAPVPQPRRRRRGTHVLALRRRRRALPELPLGDSHQQRRRASHRGSRRRELTSSSSSSSKRETVIDVPSVLVDETESREGNRL